MATTATADLRSRRAGAVLGSCNPIAGRPRRLTAQQEQALAETIVKGPDPEVDGLSAYTLDDLCVLVKARFASSYTDRGMSKLVRRLGFSRQKARLHHPDRDDAAQAAFKFAQLARYIRISSEVQDADRLYQDVGLQPVNLRR